VAADVTPRSAAGHRFVERAGLPVLTWDELDGSGVDAIVTTRAGGVSTGAYSSLNLGLHVGDDQEAVIENRRRAANAVELTLDDLVFVDQVHGRAVAVVGSSDRGRGARNRSDDVVRADALVTTTPDVGLVVMVADCVPIVMTDPDARVLACVHAGWRGTVARVTDAAVSTMVDHGAEPARIVAWLGPAIGVDRYEVGDDVAEAARDGLGAVEGVLFRSGDRWRFDLWAANRQLLERAGIASGNIAVAPHPTGEGRFFSDRAERPCGRFAAIARLRPRPTDRPAQAGLTFAMADLNASDRSW
jgi:polyphenol oxidase